MPPSAKPLILKLHKEDGMKLFDQKSHEGSEGSYCFVSATFATFVNRRRIRTALRLISTCAFIVI